MESLHLPERINKYFPTPGSNRGFTPATFIQTLILMQHEGSFHLDDVRHIKEDAALRAVLSLNIVPEAGTLGAWLVRMGDNKQVLWALREVNKAVLQSALHQCKGITLDIDATEVVSHKADAKWTYNKNIRYAIRAKMSKMVKEQIDALTDADWAPLLNKQGQSVDSQDTYRTVHCISDYEQPFTLIIQRTRIQGQVELDLDPQCSGEEICSQGYVYRAIATNQDDWSDSRIIHWYNQRGEDSENRIKELKLDFGGDTLPCSDFNANALYFLISALSYNLFALMRQLLPEQLASHRAPTLRWRLYAVAAKVGGRQLVVTSYRQEIKCY